MNIKHFRAKMLATIVVFVSLMTVAVCEVPCVFLATFHVPCISCGMTRACMAALRFDIPGAFAYHPMFWSVPVLYLYALFDGDLFRNKAVNRVILAAVAAGFLLHYFFALKNWFYG